MGSARSSLTAMLFLTGVLITAGCSTLGSLAYFVNPNDVPAEYDGLTGKHVAVVCKPVVELQYSDAGSAKELAQLVGLAIDRNIRRAEVISQEEVARWMDENELVEYRELGKALDADVVIGIDLEDFRLYEGSTLYRGTATVHVQAHDVAEGKLLFEKRMDEFRFPKDTAIPSTDRTEPQFRAMFMQVLSSKIARLFYAHDSRMHFAEENLSF
jgi:hypothetical protein